MAEDLKNTFEVFMNKEGMLIARFNQLITDPDDNAKQAQMVVDGLIALAREHPGEKFNILIDLTPLGRATYVSGETRKIYAQGMKDPQLRKLAVIGQSVAYQVVLDFIVSSINRQERVRWFGDVKKAITWLKKDK